MVIFFFWTGAGFKILEALKTLRSSPPQNPHGRLIFFVFKYIYICGCIYQLPLPIYKMAFQILYKMEVPDTDIWSCSHIKWCWVCINRSLSTKWSAPTAKKNNKIWFIGGPRPTILNGKCQRGSRFKVICRICGVWGFDLIISMPCLFDKHVIVVFSDIAVPNRTSTSSLTYLINKITVSGPWNRYWLHLTNLSKEV